MPPSSLLNVPAELMRARAQHSRAASLPMAGVRERMWASLVCLGFIGLSLGLIIALR